MPAPADLMPDILAPLAGRIPTVPPGVRLYAIGDVHGRLDLLHQIERQIERDTAAAPGLRHVQVMLGDYIDRGPESRGVIAHLMARRSGRELVTLRGNHELFMLDLDPVDVPNWCRYGGRQTLASYGLDLSDLDEAAIEASVPDVIGRVRTVLPADHAAFLASTRLSWRCGDYLFVHAGIRPGIALAAQDPRDLVWIRRDFLDHDGDHGLVVVHGHTPTPEPEIRRNRIGIDTKAYESGRLTCLVLEGDTQRFLTT